MASEAGLESNPPYAFLQRLFGRFGHLMQRGVIEVRPLASIISVCKFLIS